MKIPLSPAIKNAGLTRGAIVRSTAGHDRHEIFLVLRIDNGFAWLADGGCSRRHERPKKKRVSHVRAIGSLPDVQELDQIDSLGDAGQRNAAVRKLLKSFSDTYSMKEDS